MTTCSSMLLTHRMASLCVGNGSKTNSLWSVIRKPWASSYVGQQSNSYFSTKIERKEVDALSPMMEITERKRIPPHVVARRVSRLRSVSGKEKNIRHSPWRMNLVCQFISGLTVPEALVQLEFCEKKRGAPILKKVLKRTKNLADIRYGMAPSQLQVHTCFATPGTPLKRIKIMGRGRSGVKHRKHSHIHLSLRETDFALEMARAPTLKKKQKWYQRYLIAAQDAALQQKEQEEIKKLQQEQEQKEKESETS
eukprot:CAMPEP_0197829142 /NCGR_PEP_ID=MMETSP1437-20131217/5600_1 /TAXON_ID=49252 ORGANISM="Eucampia antarctica, Strain CCMP1452" /NCGR_SAMPLE_ID=MMETSP1437 /ASSEMBLY_ACC=CAM_ASM_001096 /LENGTH=251 /DNA_ID=CAMNT_0043430659 /DNA_START=39 /DNA_END=794 /DNA_ORIENTATION=-